MADHKTPQDRSKMSDDDIRQEIQDRIKRTEDRQEAIALKRARRVSVFRSRNLRSFHYVPRSFTSATYIQEGKRQDAEELSDCVEQFVSELGYVKCEEGELKRGSWIKRAVYKARKTLKMKEVKDRADIAEDLLFGQLSVDVDVKIVDMVAKLAACLDKQNSAAAIDAGAFLFLKIPDPANNEKYQLISKRLTAKDRTMLNNDPTLVEDPLKLLSRLKSARVVSEERIEYMRGKGETIPRVTSQEATVDDGEEAVDRKIADQARRAHRARATADRVTELIEPTRSKGRSDLSTTHTPSPPTAHAERALSRGGRKAAAGPKV